MAKKLLNNWDTQQRWWSYRKRAVVFQGMAYMMIGFGLPVDITFFALPYLALKVFGPGATLVAALVAGGVVSVLFLGLSLYLSAKANKKELGLKADIANLQKRDVMHSEKRVQITRQALRNEKINKKKTRIAELKVALAEWLEKFKPEEKKNYKFKDATLPDAVKPMNDRSDHWMYCLINGFKYFCTGAVNGVGVGWGFYGLRMISPYTPNGLLVIVSIALVYSIVNSITEGVLVQDQKDEIARLEVVKETLLQQKKHDQKTYKILNNDNERLDTLIRTLKEKASAPEKPLQAELANEDDYDTLTKSLQKYALPPSVNSFSDEKRETLCQEMAAKLKQD